MVWPRMALVVFTLLFNAGSGVGEGVQVRVKVGEIVGVPKGARGGVSRRVSKSGQAL